MTTRRVHLLSILVFLLITFFLTVGRIGTSFRRFALLTPDLGVYASFAAAQENPALFTADPLLAHEENTNDYDMLYYPLVRALKGFFGNYGTASIALLPLCLFLHLLGFYIFGWVAFRNPWAALCTSLLLSAPLELTSLREYWGLTLDPLPRFLYQCLLPYVLAFALRFGRELKFWPLILAFTGLLTYVHPLGTPPWGAAIALGLWLAAPARRFRQKFGMLALAVLAFLVVIGPFLFTYLSGTRFGADTGAGYAQVADIVRERFPEGALQPQVSLLNFAREGWIGSSGILWYLVWLLALTGIAFSLLRSQDAEARFTLRTLAAWMAGILIGGAGLPILEHLIFARLQLFPPEIEVIRGLRYLVPLALFAGYYFLMHLRPPVGLRFELSSRLRDAIFAGLSLLFLLAWSLTGALNRTEMVAAVRQDLACLRQGRLVCPLPPKRTDLIDVLEAVQAHTPPGAPIFSEGQEVAVRYYALRPLVYSYKDGPPFAYTSHAQLVVWYDRYVQMTELERMRRFSFRRRGFLRDLAGFAGECGAQYLILQEPYQPGEYYPPALTLLYSNATYSLYSLSP